MGDPVWREWPGLKGKFHPECLDDIEVLIHDGGPRFSQNPPELAWVRVLELVDPGGTEWAYFKGQLLNSPTNLRNVSQGDAVMFIPGVGSPHPVMVTAKYLAERPSWVIQPCQKCGFGELFDAPSDLIRRIFPNNPPDAKMQGFSSFCPLCRGVQLVVDKDADFADDPPDAAKTTRKWWQFWR